MTGQAKDAAQANSRAWPSLKPELSPWILEAILSMGYTRMTPVQASTIPLFTGNKDVVVEAVTGSGKTLAFLLPVVQRLLCLEEPIKKHHVGAIIISPTRELATQIHSVLTSLLLFHPPSAEHLRLLDTSLTEDEPEDPTQRPAYNSSTLKVIPQLLLGGTTTPAQDLAWFLTHSPNLLVATPGRLLELLSSPHVHCPQSSFQVLVMDEADRLLDMGFKEDLQKILQRLPKQRRTGLFSASISDAVDELVRVGLRNPVRVAVKVRSRTGEVDGRTPASLQMTYLTTPPSHKLPALMQLIHRVEPAPLKTIAYLSTCAAVDYFQHLLPIILPSGSSLTVVPLHGKHSPQVRQKNFTRFVNSSSPALLLTTDLAARGLDIPAVDLTVQIDPPSDPKTFIHRAGRAGRAGRKGLSCVFLLPGHETEDYPSFLAVRKTPVELLNKPPIIISEEEAESCIQTMRSEVLKDRNLHEKAQKGFVSWVRSYSKHTASSIFRVRAVPWDDVAASWGLLKMPKMPELKKAPPELWSGDMTLGLSIDWDDYGYKDKQREHKRKADHEDPDTSLQKAEKKPKKIKKDAWSEKHADQAEREARRKKKEIRRTKERESKMNPVEKERDEELKSMIEQLRASH